MINDFLAIGFLVALEGLLSFDNALALAAMVRYLPEAQRKKALTYGMWGAFLFRFGALCIVTYLMQATWVKLLGGGYLLWLAGSHFFAPAKETEALGTAPVQSFWKIVVMVEVMDIAFSIDSILAAVAVSNKLWIVVTGGILGIIAMRFVAGVFIGLIEKFPRLVDSAFLLVAIVGSKLAIEALQTYLPIPDPLFDFEHGRAAHAVWVLMGLALAYGFIRPRSRTL